MKICNKCNTEKTDEEFEASPFIKADGQPSRRRTCRKCVYKARRGEPGSPERERALAHANHYKKNKGRLIVVQRLAWVDEKKNKPCEDCNNRFPPECMDFDHVDPATKLFSVSAGVLKACVSLDEVEREIAKCRLICANCHRIRTARQCRRGWKPEEAQGRPRPKKYGRITKAAT